MNHLFYIMPLNMINIMPVKHDMRGVGVVTLGGIAAGADAAGGKQRRHGSKRAELISC